MVWLRCFSCNGLWHVAANLFEFWNYGYLFSISMYVQMIISITMFIANLQNPQSTHLPRTQDYAKPNASDVRMVADDLQHCMILGNELLNAMRVLCDFWFGKLVAEFVNSVTFGSQKLCGKENDYKLFTLTIFIPLSFQQPNVVIYFSRNLLFLSK